MAFTLTQLSNLESAISQGATTVKYADKTVTYRDLKEMMELRDVMKRELGLVSRKPVRVYPKYCKGL